MVTITHHTVRRDEIDRMGIVHHSNYLVWFENGRKEYFKKAGLPLSEIRAKGFFLPLSEMNCEFRRPARHGEELVIETRMTFLSCVKLKFEYTVYDASGRNSPLALGRTVHAWTDRKIRAVNLEKAAPEIYVFISDCLTE